MVERTHPHSVENGVLLRSSPSQCVTWLKCRRRWFFDKVLRVPRKPEGQAPKTGKACHSQAEHYLETGEDVLGPIMRAGKQFMPAPGKDLLIEAPVHFVPQHHKDCKTVNEKLYLPGPTGCVPRCGLRPDDPHLAWPKLWAAGVPMIGFIDLLNPRGFAQGLIEVLDHKTTSSIELWSKTEAQLWKDPQSASYLEWAGLFYPTINNFRFSHINYQTRGAPRANTRWIDADRRAVADMWAAVVGYVEEMKQAAGLKNVTDLEPTLSSCDAYGGCDYRPQCPASRSGQFKEALLAARAKLTNAAPAAPPPAAGGTMGLNLMSRMLNRTPDAAAPATPTPPAATVAPAVVAPPPAAVVAPPSPPPPAVVVAPAGEVLASTCAVGSLYEVENDEGKKVTAAFFGTSGLWALFRTATAEICRAKLTATVGLGKAPEPPAVVVTPVLPNTGVVPFIPANTPAAILPPDAPKSDPALAAVDPKTPAQPMLEGAPAEEKKKRTRRTKEQIAADEAAAKASAGNVDAGIATAATPTNDIPPPGVEGEKQGLALYVNCIPSGRELGEITDLAGYVAGLAADAARGAELPDCRVADSGPLAFGRWKGYLAAMARENPPTGHCHITRSEIADPIIEALKPLADFYVQPTA